MTWRVLAIAGLMTSAVTAAWSGSRPGASESVGDVWTTVRSAIAAGDDAAAERLLADLLATLDPAEAAEAHRLLGLLAIRRGELSVGLSHWNRAGGPRLGRVSLTGADSLQERIERQLGLVPGAVLQASALDRALRTIRTFPGVELVHVALLPRGDEVELRLRLSEATPSLVTRSIAVGLGLAAGGGQLGDLPLDDGWGASVGWLTRAPLQAISFELLRAPDGPRIPLLGLRLATERLALEAGNGVEKDGWIETTGVAATGRWQRRAGEVALEIGLQSSTVQSSTGQSSTGQSSTGQSSTGSDAAGPRMTLAAAVDQRLGRSADGRSGLGIAAAARTRVGSRPVSTTLQLASSAWHRPDFWPLRATRFELTVAGLSSVGDRSDRWLTGMGVGAAWPTFAWPVARGSVVDPRATPRHALRAALELSRPLHAHGLPLQPTIGVDVTSRLEGEAPVIGLMAGVRVLGVGWMIGFRVGGDSHAALVSAARRPFDGPAPSSF